jgi:hypothetical protein
MKRLALLALTLLVSACGGGGTDPIPEKVDLSAILWKWTALDAGCQHITAVGSGLTTGRPDTVYHVKKKTLEIDEVSAVTKFGYVVFSDESCTSTSAEYEEVYSIAEWVVPNTSSGVPAQLIYMGSAGHAPEFTPALVLKVLFAPSQGQLKLYEDTLLAPDQLDADGYPLGNTPPAATFVRP